MKYNKMFIIGIAGSGKTHLANKISKILKIKSYDLDKIVFRKKDFTRVKDLIRDEKVNKILNDKKWLIEGSYTSDWVIPIIKKSNLIVFLNVNILKAKKRLLFRFIKRKMFENEKPESLKDFLTLSGYSNKSVSKRKMNFSKRFSKKYKKKIIVLNNNEEINKFLKSFIN